ncbi:glycosyltransferase family 2 protein [archaeon]|jgi:glycosyltransferase involved in cell wall biosynthesis|nr:glycosyltransferase family 2 protein [archaeon]MBT4352384.1 glycosyltransferase family 2 protein [archaeon]MBT4646636.1 glycosyltransferase family 2 protein [archaeon]MBT6821915.1 glycosyltransferase family 2 protein [archaeon]MBT7391859.1 glycosyltransferase family 2 protein [archaeon]
MKTAIIIPVMNEELALSKLLDEMPKKYLENTIVVSNGSTDNTSKITKEKGAYVIETEAGYGRACLVGIDYCKKINPDVVIFMDGKYTDDPKDIPKFINEINEGYDFVLGTRGGFGYSHQKFGNKLAVFLIKLFWKYEYTDLGPYRAIKFDKLLKLDMKDKNFGWTVEMQIRAAKKKLKFSEIKVNQRKRIGKSKISGTTSGTIKAGSKILWVVFRELFI